MTSTSGMIAFAARKSSSPVRPGILRSVTMRSTPPACTRSRAARPSEARTTRYPSRVSVRSRLSRSPGSSSATSSVAGSDMRRLLDRQPDRERRTPTGAVRPPELAAVLLGDLAGDRETEAGALGFRGEELLEELGTDVVGDTLTRVGDRDLDPLAVEAACDRQLAAARKRLEAVLDEVPHGLAQQAAVDLHHRHVRVDLDAEREPLAARDGADEVGELLHEVVDRLLLEVGSWKPGEGEVLLGQGVERGDLVADRGDETHRFLHILVAPRADNVLEHLRVQLDRADRVAHLVRDLERDAPDLRHALGHDQLLLGRLQAAQRARELIVQPLHLAARPPLPVSARIDRHHREDADLVGPEPEDKPVEVDLVAGPQWKEAERGETTDHDDGQEDREHTLVALQQPKDRVPRFPLAGCHGHLDDYSIGEHRGLMAGGSGARRRSPPRARWRRQRAGRATVARGGRRRIPVRPGSQ